MRVLVATDLSPAADAALLEGAALASSADDSLAVIHVLPPLHPVSVLDQAVTESVRARIAHVIRPPELFVEVGPAYAEIVKRAEAWRADVVLVAAHGHSGIARVLGGVAVKVVRHAHCKVLVVRPTPARGCVLAATDLSEASLPAVVEAAKQAKRLGAKLKVVHAIGFLEVEATYLAEMSSPSIANRDAHLDASLRDLKLAIERVGVEADCAILDSPAAAAVAREAETSEAQLVVVSTHGRTGLARLALGSVAEKIVRLAPCSVLAVRTAKSAR